MKSVTRYRFGDFTLDLEREALVHDGKETRLRPKCFQVLKVLVEHHGRLVTKEHLHEAVWAPSIVSDDSLAHCLIEIRRALGEAGRDMIRTVPRRGYVFESDVEFVDRPRPRRMAHPPRPRRPLISIAVLALAGVAFVGFRVAETPSPTNEQSIGDTDIEVPAVPESADEAIPTDVESTAYRHYLRGRFFYDRRAPGDIDRAEAAYRRAVEADPSLAAAWTGLAAIYNFRLFDGSMAEEEALYRLGQAAHRALALDPDDGEAQARMAAYFLRIGQTGLADEHFDRALALEPDNPLLLSMLAGRLFHAARLGEAIALQRRAAELAPLSPVYSNNLVSILLAAGRTGDAREALENLEALTPSDVQRHAAFKADMLIVEGRYDEALQPALQLADDELRDSRLAIIHEALGSVAEARAAFERLESSDSQIVPYLLAAVLAWRGEPEAAFERLSRAGDADYLRSLPAPERLRVSRKLLSPLLAPLRRDPRWEALVAATQPDSRLRPTSIATADAR